MSTETLQKNYLGFIVVKPLPSTVVGRTCLKTYDDDGDLLSAIFFDVNNGCVLHIEILLASGALSIKSSTYIYLLESRFVSSVEHLAGLLL